MFRIRNCFNLTAVSPKRLPAQLVLYEHSNVDEIQTDTDSATRLQVSPDPTRSVLTGRNDINFCSLPLAPRIAAIWLSLSPPSGDWRNFRTQSWTGVPSKFHPVYGYSRREQLTSRISRMLIRMYG